MASKKIIVPILQKEAGSILKKELAYVSPKGFIVDTFVPSPKHKIYWDFEKHSSSRFQTGALYSKMWYSDSAPVLYNQKRHYSTNQNDQRKTTFISWGKKPVELEESVFQLFGYNPTIIQNECPILTAPYIDVVGRYLQSLNLQKIKDFTGTVNMSKLGHGMKHFYLHAAYAGNIRSIASTTGVPEEIVFQCLTSLCAMLATWGGCMMAGGATFSLNNYGKMLVLQDVLAEMSSRELMGHARLTWGNDIVALSNPKKIHSGKSSYTSFLARTTYCHALYGSVLHNCYIDALGDIYWFWVGAGGGGLISKYVNNIVATDMDIGMWPDMAASIRNAYSDTELMKAFMNMKPDEIGEIVRQMNAATSSKKGTFKNILQGIQVSGGYPIRAMSSISGLLKTGSMYEIKGINENNWFL